MYSRRIRTSADSFQTNRRLQSVAEKHSLAAQAQAEVAGQESRICDDLQPQPQSSDGHERSRTVWRVAASLSAAVPPPPPLRHGLRWCCTGFVVVEGEV